MSAKGQNAQRTSGHQTPETGEVSPRLRQEDLLTQLAEYSRERIAQHEDKSYENFRLFLQLSTVIAGGLGYLALSDPKEHLWKIQSLAWGLWYLELFVVVVFCITLGLEYLALRRHWKLQVDLGIKKEPVPSWHFIKHVQVYFFLGMVVFIFGLYCLVMKRLFI